MTYEDTAFEVECFGRDRRAYAMLPVKAERLMVLHDAADSMVA